MSRVELRGRPHHYIGRNGPDVERRLRDTTLYRPELGLAVVDTDGEAVADGLFWYDPTTDVGFVEPMRTREQHRRKGLARHVFTAGLDRLARTGARRLKINFENDNAASSTLYLDAGFRR